MKLLVTGGAGFIGSNFLYYITDKRPNYDVVCLDSLTYASNLKTIKPLIDKGNILFVKGDIKDRDLVFNLFKNHEFDYVVNFAAESHVDRSINDPEIFLQTNIIGTQVLLDACRKFNVKRFHQVSTDEVYGDLPLNRPDLLFTEDMPLKASSPYSASKAAADLLVLSYNRTYQLPVTISRCSNNYGPFQFPEKLIPLIISRAIDDKYLPIYGKGENVRDWLHVFDHCAAIDIILHMGKDGDVYNVGGNNEKTNIQVVKTILKHLGKPYTLIKYVEDRAGHDLRYAIDPSKTIIEFGWKPSIDFNHGIKQTIQWYIDNQEWLKNIEKSNV